MDFLPVVGRVPGARRRLGRRRLLRPRQRARLRLRRARRVGGAGRGRTVARALRPGAAAERARPRASRRGRSSPSAFASAAVAIARSWIASPVESKSVMSLGAAAAVGLAREHAADLGHPVSRDDARLDARSELAAVLGLLPVVAEEVGARELRRSRPRPCRARRRPSAIRAGLPRASPRRRARLGPGVTVTTMSAASASASDGATCAPSYCATAAARASSTSQTATSSRAPGTCASSRRR